MKCAKIMRLHRRIESLNLGINGFMFLFVISPRSSLHRDTLFLHVDLSRSRIYAFAYKIWPLPFPFWGWEVVHSLFRA